jgi:hypothetical protein
MTDDQQAITRIRDAALDVGPAPEQRIPLARAMLQIAGHLNKRLAQHWVGHASRDRPDPVATALHDLMSEIWNACFAADMYPVIGPNSVRESHRTAYVNTRAEVGRKMIEILDERGIRSGTA